MVSRGVMTVAASALLVALALVSLLFLSAANDSARLAQQQHDTGRRLLHSRGSSSSSSSSSDHSDDDDGSETVFGGHVHDDGGCDPSAVAHAYIAAWNEGRHEAQATMFTPDALRYVNGRLDDLTDGKPSTAEQNKCVHERGRIEYHAGDIVTSGHSIAAVSGTILVQRAMTGLAIVLELDPASCRIETERLFFSTDSEAYRVYASEFACSCYPLLEELGACHPEEPPAPIDLAAIAEQCWRHVVTGNARAFAGCFTPDVRFVDNGEPKPSAVVADVAQVQAYIDAFATQAVVQHTLAEGFVLHTVVSRTLTSRADGASADETIYQVAKFNEDGKITELWHATDTTTSGPLFERALGLPPRPLFWKSQAALNSLGTFVAELGAPDDYTDFIDATQTNWAMWGAATLSARNMCFSSVVVSDRDAVHQQPNPHVVFAWVDVALPSQGRDNDVRAVSDSLTYDALTGTLRSTNNGLGQAVVDLYLGARVMAGQTSVANARQSYAQLIANVHAANGGLSPEFQRLRNDLCALV